MILSLAAAPPAGLQGGVAVLVYGKKVYNIGHEADSLVV